jgi:uncharacterized protein (TIGR02266 family)
LRKKKVLLVDDIRLFLDQEMSILSRDDFEVLVARNGVEALKIIMEEMPEVVFMDLFMPEMDGDRCCFAVKSDEKLRHIPVIMVTQGTSDEDFERCWQAGCDDIIAKPINRHFFLALAQRHLNIQLRKFPRHPARLRIHYRCGADTDRILADYSVNLSTGGIFLETSELLPIDSLLKIEFMLPECARIIKCSGKVSWVNHPESIKNKNLPVGMGLQFVNLPLDDIDSIRIYIKDQALTAVW